MTGLDWLIIAFALAMAFWGYQQGLIVGVLSLAGFAIGAFLGSRLGPALLPDGSHSPYAPATALAGALLVGGIVAVSMEGLAFAARRRLLGSAGRHRGLAVVESSGGALLLVALALAIAWLFGAVALNAPGAKSLRQAVQESAILRALNDAFPPSSGLIKALNRIDPRVSVQGPSPDVAPPDSKIARDPEVRAASTSVVRVLGTACGLGVEGSGWIAEPGIVVTNAHVVAGETDTTVTPAGSDSSLDATPVHYDPSNDLALLRVNGLQAGPLSFAPNVTSGTPGAVIGYPENGPLTITPARAGATGPVITEDSYGRGPVTRELTALRGEVHSGNSGGPLVDGSGRVMGTVFAATTQGKPGGYAVPNGVVAGALGDSTDAVSTGPCTR
ncbi:MAG TPA: MarP family serine protease [Solirubrobacterales bacterium]|nr:MarP family serine protease [Solirubrobacterales bacterium]